MAISLKWSSCGNRQLRNPSFIIFIKLFKINKNIQDTLSLRVTRSGTKKPDTTYSCIRLLSTGGSPVSFMFFVNFSQFDLDFMSFAIV